MLQNTWRLQVDYIRTRCNTLRAVGLSDRSFISSSTLSSLFELRFQMAYFIDNLEAFLQRDVLSTQHILVQQRIETIGELENGRFDLLRNTLMEYLTSIYSQCFLSIRSIAQALFDIIDLAHGFSAFFERAMTTDVTMMEDNLEKYRVTFEKNAQFLFRTLSNAKENLNNPYLTQLLMRLDFNQFFSRVV